MSYPIGTPSSGVANIWEGTFTPSWTNLTINSGSPTYIGWYTKVGRLITVGWQISGTFNITLTANSTRITNLPFSSTQNEWGVWGNVSATNASYGMQTSSLNLWMAATVSSTSSVYSGTVTYYSS